MVADSLNDRRYERQRRQLIETIADQGIDDLEVLRVFDLVPRHIFLPESARRLRTTLNLAGAVLKVLFVALIALGIADGVAYEYFKRCLAENPEDPQLLALAGAGLAAFDDPDAETPEEAAEDG